MSISQGMRFRDSAVGEYNLEIIARDVRGEIVQRSETHNIVTNIGRQYLSQRIISALARPSAVAYSDDVIRAVGFGIGGSLQSDTTLANTTPGLGSAYNALGGGGFPGTNTQTDLNPTITGLERPVRVVDGADGTTGLGGAIWMRDVALATAGSFPTSTSVRFVAFFSSTDLNDVHGSMPLSEIGLYLGTADVSYANGVGTSYPGAGGKLVAYDTFATIHKTGAISMEIRWDFRF